MKGRGRTLRNTGLAAAGIVLLLAAGCTEDNVEHTPNGWEGTIGQKDGQLAPDHPIKQCGSCSGANCCCNDLDSECLDGYLCFRDKQCMPWSAFKFELSFSGQISLKDRQGQSWDGNNGKPDPVLIVWSNMNRLCESDVKQNTNSAALKCKYALSVPAHKAPLRIQILDDDGGGKQTLIYEISVPGGFVLKNIAAGGVSLTATPVLSGPKVVLKKRAN